MNMLETIFHETRECRYYLHRRAALFNAILQICFIVSMIPTSSARIS